MTMLAKVNFNLISVENSAGANFYFNTDIEGLKRGDIVIVMSRGKATLGNFVGYSNKEYKASSEIIRKATHVEVKEYWDTVEQNLRNNLLQISEEALYQYRNNFKNNNTTSAEDVQKKLNRNIILAIDYGKARLNNAGHHTVNYGQQQIKIHNSTVVGLKALPKKRKFYKNFKKYNELNKLFNIEN